MGQQQLLLLVLGIVIVGLSVVVGINAFSQSQKKSNADAMLVEALNIVSRLQSWSLKPAMIGGKGANETLADVTLDDVGYANQSGTYHSLDGTFTLDASANSECDEPVIPSGNAALIYINGYDDNSGNYICVAVAGTQTDDIGTSTTYGGGVEEAQ
ncbi:MAG TPA: hypothetical protein VKP65_01285 [Rhodothermales bacterium]|nr:hypothetical protein [Rhodothermales bacterium]